VAKTNPIPTRLKAARKAAKITQKDLGVRVGMELSSASSRMNHYEKGRHTPDINTLQRMADELGVPLNYFFCESDVAARLACLIDELSEEQQLELINELTEKK
jgi:transcriptional regulator with XRE-family HTH domain